MPALGRSSWPRWARLATSPWLLSPVLVLTLLAGSFLTYGAYSRSKTTHYARGGASFYSDDSGSRPPDAPAPSASKPDNAAVHAGKGGPKPPHGAGRSPDPASRSVASTGGSTSGGGTQSGALGSGASSDAVSPQTGTYKLAVSGSEHVKFGPFSACTNTFPGSSQLVVQHASGEPAGSYDFDLRFYPDSPNKHDERHIYRYSSAGVVLSYEQATVTCGGVKQSSTVSYSPAQQRVPTRLRVGAAWHNRTGDANRTEDATFKVVGTAAVTYNGRSYPTYVIDASIDMSGDESGSRDQRWWYSPDLGMPLRWHESLSGQRSGATYSEDVTVSVVSGP